MAFEYLSKLLRPPAEREVDEELAFHVEARARELQQRGMNETEARVAAAQGFGDLRAVRRACVRLAHGRAKAASRREWRSELVQDVRFALRRMRCSPGFTALASVTLALGIGRARHDRPSPARFRPAARRA